MSIFKRKNKEIVTCHECGTQVENQFTQKLQLFKEYFLGEGLLFERYFYLCDRHKQEKAEFGIIKYIGHRVKKIIYYKKVKI